jgi:Saxitoxin biosynthesis operon protein SxtJ
MKQRSLRVEREFGWIVGGVFTLLGVWWLFRGKFANLVPITLLLGLLLIFLGSVYPRALNYPNKAWMQLAELLGFVSTRIILGIVFFLIVTPIGAAKRLFGWDPLGRRAASQSTYWRPYDKRQRDPRHYEKMF